MVGSMVRPWFAGAIAAVFLAGCASDEGMQQLLGGVVGCATGAGVGAATDGGKGAAIGCVVGALTGVAAVTIAQYSSRQSRDAEADEAAYKKEDPAFYGLAEANGAPVIKIRTASAAPETVKPGEMVSVSTDYSLAVPKSMTTAPVSASWLLKKDGKPMREYKGQLQQSTGGGLISSGKISIPPDAEPGTYVVEHRVKTGTSYDKKVSVFVVQG